MNLFDMMRQAGGGDAFSALARQYGLSEDQVAKAVQAFMPAFSAGLKQSTADPLGLMEFMRKLASGEGSRAYENPAFAWGAGQKQGQDAMKFLFGSPDAARAIACQAAAFTGLAPDKLQDLLPAVASMMFGGFAKQAAAANPMMESVMNQFRTAGGEGSRAEKGPLDRYEDEQASREPDGLARTQGEMMQAGLAAFQAGAAAWQKAVGEATSVVGSSGAEKQAGAATGQNVFGEMFEPGKRLSETYQREMEAMLQRFRPDSKPQ